MSISKTAAGRSLYDSISRHLNEQEWGEDALLHCHEIALRRLSFLNSSNGENLIAGIQSDAKPRTYERPIRQLLCVPGSRNYNGMRNREDSYVIVRLHENPNTVGRSIA